MDKKQNTLDNNTYINFDIPTEYILIHWSGRFANGYAIKYPKTCYYISLIFHWSIYISMHIVNFLIFFYFKPIHSSVISIFIFIFIGFFIEFIHGYNLHLYSPSMEKSLKYERYSSIKYFELKKEYDLKHTDKEFCITQKDMFKLYIKYLTTTSNTEFEEKIRKWENGK